MNEKTDHTDLLRRLRALKIIDEVHSDNDLGRQAADAIEALREERDKWKDAVFAADQHAADLVADNAALRSLLQRWYDIYGGSAITQLTRNLDAETDAAMREGKG